MDLWYRATCSSQKSLYNSVSIFLKLGEEKRGERGVFVSN